MSRVWVTVWSGSLQDMSFTQPAPVRRASFALPLPAAIGLTVVAVVLQVLNSTTFDFGRPWVTYITVALVFLAGIGIKPSAGKSVAGLLHLPAPVVGVISAAMAAGALATAQIPPSSAWHVILPAVLTALSGLGFAAAL